MPKKRVNITIDSAVHDEMRKFLDLTGSDFSTFVEMLTLRFLGQVRPLVRRMEAAKDGGPMLTPSELRVMFLQMMGSVQVEAGANMHSILQEIDTLEADLEKKKALPVAESQPIHTEPKKRSTTKKKQ